MRLGKRTADFKKMPDGSWTFTWGVRLYRAYRNIAGFAGRDWELWTDVAGHWIIVEDMLGSRQECVDRAAEDARS